MKDFTVTKHNDKFLVYATVFDTSTFNGSANPVKEGDWRAIFMSFSDFGQMGTATQTYLSGRGAVAPTLIYFEPKKQWVLLYQWGFQFATGTDPSNPTGWSAGQSLLGGDTSKVGGNTGPIDQTAICDTTNCYLFYASDNGKIYRSSMPIGSFPGRFTHQEPPIMTDTQANLFEAVQVYSVKGSTDYLMIVEAIGTGGRYFRGFRSSSLGGTFTALPDASTENKPFAGRKNVTFENGTAWTNDISHGDLVRDDPSEKQMVDPCNLRLLYQGYDTAVDRTENPKGYYGWKPYRPGLLTKKP